MNKVILCGNLGDTPKITEQNNLKRGTFSLATNRKTKDKVFTTWHNIVGFGTIANAFEYLKYCLLFE